MTSGVQCRRQFRDGGHASRLDFDCSYGGRGVVCVRGRNPPGPTLVSISPTTARVGTPINLTAKGTNFVSITVLSCDGVSQTTTVLNGTTLTATITGDTAIGTHNVRVQSGSFSQHGYTVCGAPSDALVFTVTP